MYKAASRMLETYPQIVPSLLSAADIGLLHDVYKQMGQRLKEQWRGFSRSRAVMLHKKKKKLTQ